MDMERFVLLLITSYGALTCENCTSPFAEAKKSAIIKFLETQKGLSEKLFKDYDNAAAPIYTISLLLKLFFLKIGNSDFLTSGEVHPEPFPVLIDLVMLRLISVEEPLEKATFIFDYMATWTDVRLLWDPNEYGGIEHFYTTREKLWFPEIATIDAHEVKDNRDDDEKFVVVNYNGTIQYYAATVTSVACPMNVFKFPFDGQLCKVKLMSHVMRPEEYRLVNVMDSLSLPVSQLGNGEWQVVDLQSGDDNILDETGAIVVSIRCFKMKLLRNSNFYVALIIIPAFVVNTLSITAVFLRHDNLVEKFTVGLTNIMSMTFILGILAADLPKTKALPMLAIFVLGNLGLMVLSIVAVIWLIRVRKKYEKQKKRRAASPSALSRYFFEGYGMDIALQGLLQAANVANLVALFL